MKASLYWWTSGLDNNKMRSQHFEDYYSEEFDEKLTELQNDPSVCCIEIAKSRYAIKSREVHEKKVPAPTQNKAEPVQSQKKDHIQRRILN